MTFEVDPQRIQRLEHHARLLQERLRQNMAKQYDLQREEGELKCELVRIENDKYQALNNQTRVPEIFLGCWIPKPDGADDK